MKKLDSNSFKAIAERYKCVACFKEYRQHEYFVEHMKISYHSVHQPRCGVCEKFCKSFESLREHMTGKLAKARCSSIFSQKGCEVCLKVFPDPYALSEHQESCILTAPAPIGTTDIQYNEYDPMEDEIYVGKCPEAVAIDCQLVGSGDGESLGQLARVCLVDEDENIIFHTFVKPQEPVTDYRYEVTGLTEAHLRDAMPLTEVQAKIHKILYNGESVAKARLHGGKAKLLVGHNLERYLDGLLMNYPEKLLRDTSLYPPLMKTNMANASHALKYLTKTYLGYDIRSGIIDTYQDCVSVMRLYKRMRSQEHQDEKSTMQCSNNTNLSVGFDDRTSEELEDMSPDQLLEISVSDYQCWCLDSRPCDPPREWY